MLLLSSAVARFFSLQATRSFQVAPQGTVVTSGPARLSEIAWTAVLAASGPPRAARGSAGPAAHASSIDGPSVPPPSPASGPAT